MMYAVSVVGILDEQDLRSIARTNVFPDLNKARASAEKLAREGYEVEISKLVPIMHVKAKVVITEGDLSGTDG